MQALGRLLTHSDINERLKGRRAELYWPDDNLWYLIEIHEVSHYITFPLGKVFSSLAARQ